MNVRFDQNRGAKPWCLDLGIVSGYRKREYYATEKLANDAMRDRKVMEREGGKMALELTPADRLEFITAKEIATSLGTTVIGMALAYKANPRTTAPKRLADAISECVESKRSTGKRIVYVKAIRRALENFGRQNPNAMVSSIGREEVEKWIRGGDPALATMRSRLINVQTLFNFCIKRKWLVENPVKEVEPIMADTRPPGIHTPENTRALLACCLANDPSVIGYIAPILFGGMRPIESANLEAHQIRDGLVEVTPEKSKTRRRRLVPINPTLAAWLAVAGVRYGMDANCIRLVKIRKLLSREAPFPWPHDVLRHSFCSYGLPKYGASKIAEWAGHSEQILFAHYRERVRPDDVERYWALRPENVSV